MSDEVSTPVPIEARIYTVRGQRVMLGLDLAEIFGVPNFRLTEAVKRNRKRFPKDFTFQLTPEEVTILTSQIAISRPGWGGRRAPPYAFTEHGAIMLASVLNSPRAVEMSIYVVRAFVQLRVMIVDHKELAARLEELEGKVSGHDQALQTIVAAVRQLTNPPPAPPRPRIGFSRDGKSLQG